MKTPFWRTTGIVAYDLFRLLCHGMILMILAGFLGAFFPLGDSLAVFRIELTGLLAGLAVIALILRRSFIPPAAVITIIISAGSILPFRAVERPEIFAEEPPQLTLHQHNLLYGNRDHPGFLAYVRAYGPDMLTLQEFDGRNVELVDELRKTHPKYHVCLYDTGGVGVFARGMRKIASGCKADAKLAWMEVETAAGPVMLVSIHLFWPFPMPQFWQVPAYTSALEDLAARGAPVILGGDFNMVPWGASVQQIASAIDGRISRGLEPTFHWQGRAPTFRIDHVIAPTSATMAVRRLPKLGSDHNGLWADIRMDRGAIAEPEPGETDGIGVVSRLDER